MNPFLPPSVRRGGVSLLPSSDDLPKNDPIIPSERYSPKKNFGGKFGIRKQLDLS
jgi:hypothetical protein